VYHCQKLSKSAQNQQSYCKNKKGGFFETQCIKFFHAKKNYATQVIRSEKNDVSEHIQKSADIFSPLSDSALMQ